MDKVADKLQTLHACVQAGKERFDKRGKLNHEYVKGVVIRNLQEVLPNVCRTIEKEHVINESDPSSAKQVVHYTSVATIVSMLQACATRKREKNNLSGKPHESSQKKQTVLWRLYDSAHFNDPVEGQYLAKILSLDKKHDWICGTDVTHAYVASFIIPRECDPNSGADDLVFWRTYGREGEGCSLKLDIPSNKFRKVLYGPDAVAKTGQLLTPILEILDPLATVRDRSIRQMIREAFWHSMGTIQFLYKSEAYEYERECRVVANRRDISDDDICFEYRDEKNRNGRLRHYYEDTDLDVPQMLSSQSVITIGPCVADRDDLCRSLRVLKNRAELGPRINISEIPYRKT